MNIFNYVKLEFLILKKIKISGLAEWTDVLEVELAGLIYMTRAYFRFTEFLGDLEVTVNLL